MSVKLSSMIQNQGLGSRSDAGASKNKPNRGLQALVVVAVATIVYFGWRVANYSPGARVAEAAPVATAVVMEHVPTSTPAPAVVVVTATPDAGGNFGVGAATEVPPVVVTQLVTVTEYVVDKITIPVEVPVEVTRIVEVPLVPLPTPTVVPGQVRLCIYVEGVSGVFINGAGLAGNSCYTYDVSSPVNDFKLTVTGGESYVRSAVEHNRDD